MSSRPTPTRRELQILKVLWAQGPRSVRQVHRTIVSGAAEDHELTQKTVYTLLRIMKEKGLVTHEVRGRTFVFFPAYSREESAWAFLERVFDGAVPELVMSLLRIERITPEELERVQEMIGEARRKMVRP